jgi:hypothetical protein
MWWLVSPNKHVELDFLILYGLANIHFKIWKCRRKYLTLVSRTADKMGMYHSYIQMDLVITIFLRPCKVEMTPMQSMDCQSYATLP